MKIELQYFSALRDLGGPSDLEIERGARVSDLLSRLYTAAPGLAAWDRHLLVAVGTEYVGRDALLEDGRVVSLMPPVQGG